EVKNVFGTLSNTRVDENALQTIRDAIAATVYSSGSSVKILPDLGITTERDGTLAFDTNKFNSAVSAEPNSVNSVLANFADRVSTTGGTIDVIVRFNGLLDTTITGNKNQIDDLNRRISDAEESILKQEERMRQQFANLESTISHLQSQQT